ncbi:MAG: ATP-binding protein, partial [Proteobacteria bacterium]|nr:ATP-binding protein [Pseudomonadota bacterium]
EARASGRVLLFLDEIQGSPPAIKYLRYFREEMPELHVVAAGSLLEAVIAKENVSFPVGRVQHMYLHPLSFAEYLRALGDDPSLDALNTLPFPDYALPHLLRQFHRYTLVGGMPEVVARYAQTQEPTSLGSIYSSLLTSYLDDVSKYARNPTMELVLRHAIEAAPFEAGNRIKFAGFGKSNYRSREMGEALRTLERSMLLCLLFPSTSTEVPPLADLRKSPRLQFLDTGLLNYAVGLQSDFFAFDDLHSFYRGRLAEHIVGQELQCQDPDIKYKPLFWVREKRQSKAEVDFIVQHRGLVIPVEVKAGKTGKLRSLHQFMNRCDHHFAVRLHAGPLARQQVATPEGKKFILLDLPYFLGCQLHHYLEWLMEPTS